MSRELKNLSDIKNLFEISEENITKWLNDFRDYFSEYAKREDPLFMPNDIKLLIIMNSTEDFEDIEHNITSDGWIDYASNEYRSLAPFYKHLDDMIDPEVIAERLHSLEKIQADSVMTYAKIYRRATQKLLNIVIEEHDDPFYYHRENHLIYPVVYLFRHTMELYLKGTAQRVKAGRIIGHTLEDIINKIETSANRKIPKWVKNQLLYLDSFDKEATVFRYPDEQDFYEYVVDLNQLNYLITKLCDLFETQLKYN